MPSYVADYHVRSEPQRYGTYELAAAARERLAANDREGWAWHYGLPSANDYSDYGAAEVAAYSRAVARGYQSLCRWLARHQR